MNKKLNCMIALLIVILMMIAMLPAGVLADNDGRDERLGAAGVILQGFGVREEVVVAGDRHAVLDHDEIGEGIVHDDIRPPMDALSDLDAPLALQPFADTAPGRVHRPVAQPMVFETDQAEPQGGTVPVFAGGTTRRFGERTGFVFRQFLPFERKIIFHFLP